MKLLRLVLENFLEFHGNLAVGAGAMVKVTLMADGALDDEVFDWPFRFLLWTATIAGETSDLGSTGPHHLYVTYDRPDPEGRPMPTPFGPEPAPLEDGITDKRMSAAVTLTRQQSKIAAMKPDPETGLPREKNDPHVIVEGLVSTFDHCALKHDDSVPDEFAQPTYFNARPDQAQAGAWPAARRMGRSAQATLMVSQAAYRPSRDGDFANDAERWLLLWKFYGTYVWNERYEPPRRFRSRAGGSRGRNDTRPATRHVHRRDSPMTHLHLLLAVACLAGCPTPGPGKRRGAPAVSNVAPTISASSATSVPTLEPPMPKAPTFTAPGPTLLRSLESYVTEYASAARSSRVETPYRPLHSFSRVAALEPNPYPDPYPNFFPNRLARSYAAGIVAVDRQTEHVGVVQPYHFTKVHSVQQGVVSPVGKVEENQVSLQFFDWGYLADGNGMYWVQRNDNWMRVSADAVRISDVWAVVVDLDTIGAPRYTSIVSAPSFMELPSEPVTPPTAWIKSRDLGEGSSVTHALPGTACGAIAPEGGAALAFRSGRFLVLDAYRPSPDRDSKGSHVGDYLVDVPIAFLPYDMSIVESGYAVLSDGGPLPNAAPRSDIERLLAWRARRIEFVNEGPPPRWKTVIHHLGLDGHETWQHEVPFEVLQPPIDAGHGRLYVIGNGSAAFQDGKLLLSKPLPMMMFGTAYEDGTMAICAGPELRIVNRDGRILQRFGTEGHDAIATPPAIGSRLGRHPEGSLRGAMRARPDRSVNRLRQCRRLRPIATGRFASSGMGRGSCGDSMRRGMRGDDAYGEVENTLLRDTPPSPIRLNTSAVDLSLQRYAIGISPRGPVAGAPPGTTAFKAITDIVEADLQPLADKVASLLGDPGDLTAMLGAPTRTVRRITP